MFLTVPGFWAFKRSMVVSGKRSGRVRAIWIIPGRTEEKKVVLWFLSPCFFSQFFKLDVKFFPA